MDQIQPINRQQSSVTQAVSASTAVTDTSPLSELSGTPSLRTCSASSRGDAEYLGTHVIGGSGVAHADEDSAGEQSSDEQLYRCDYCINTYDDQKNLDRHLKDNKSTCAKSRLGSTISGSVYACPRCDSQMSKKYSVERHIKDSCWKVCDECCRSSNATCDAFYIDGACKHCVQQGLSCTRHTEPVSDCAPELLTSAPPQPYKSAPRARRAGTAVQIDKGKRKTIKSPDVSPNSKPVVKRPAAAARKEKRTIAEPSDEAVRRRPLDTPQYASDEKLQEWQHVRQNIPVSGLHVQNHQDLQNYISSRPTIMAQHMQQGQGLPMPPLPSEMLRLTPGQQYDGRDVVTVDQAQSRWPKTHNSAGRMQYIVGEHGEVLNQSMIDGDELLQNIHRQQARIELWAARYDNAFRVNHVPPPPNSVVPPQNARRTSFNEAHPPESRLNCFRPVQSANFKIYEDAACRKLRSKDFVASAPGSRMPSRQSSPQSTQHPRAPARPPPSEKSRGMDAMSQTTKRPMARQLTQPIALQRSISFMADENDPVLTLRIHSNTYDMNSTPIFSILTIRASQKFGPRLEAYCQQRNKQYGVDWVFIYPYALGGPENAQREHYIKIDYNMTPNDVQDIERPEIKLRDMDTIMVMKAKSRIAAMVEHNRNGIKTPLSSIGSQVSEEVVEIIDGETPIYQNAGTIANWHRLVETKMVELRGQIISLNSENQVQKAMMAQQTRMLNDLVKRNNELVQGKYGRAAGRVDQVPPCATQFAATGGASSQRGPAVQRIPFIDRLEAVRQPTGYMASPNPMQQYRFPTAVHGMQGRRPTYDSGAREAFPDFQKNGVPTMQPAQFSAYGMSGNTASHISVPQHMRRDDGSGGGGDGGADASVEDVEMRE